jgi:DNA invertase Pin-like site-specific DNA recombinase
MSKTKPKIGAYLRVSTTDKQTTRSQKEAIKQWAKSNHIPSTELKFYEDLRFFFFNDMAATGV